MKRRHWYGVAAVMMVCTPVGGLISRAFGRAPLPPPTTDPLAACWFTPARLLMLGTLVLALTLLHHRSRQGRQI